jgi:pimeloyl-ACP methyl ester carboxylesterase
MATSRHASAAVTTARVQHGYTSVSGLRLHHLHFGGDGTPIVCLHGVVGNAWTWHQVADGLSAAGTVYATDLRGHGESQWSPDGAYSTEKHVADLSGWLDAMGLDRVVLAGYSWGALIAASVASRQPERVERLVILDVEPSFDVGAEDVPPMPTDHASHAAAVDSERAASTFVSPETAELMAAVGTRPATDGRLVPRFDPYFFEHWPFRDDDHWAELEGLEMPVLVVHAADSFVRREVMEEMAKRIPQGEFVEVADCGHVMPVDNPDGVVAAVLPFLKKSPGNGG